MKKTFNEFDHDLNTFSGRLNAILDFVDHYPPVNQGRSRELAIEFSCSKSSARVWLLHNHIPTQRQLRQIIETSLSKIKSNLTIDTVIGWVTYGQAVPCPFTEPEMGAIPIDFSAQLAKITIIAFNEAEKCGISNFCQTLGEEGLEEIYRKAISGALKSKDKTISPKTIRSLIKDQLKNMTEKSTTTE